MKTTIIIFVGFILLAVSAAYTQSDEYPDVIYLKNGNKIVGIITENILGKKVTIKTRSGSVFTFESAEILNIEGKEEEVIIQTTPPAKDVSSDSTETKRRDDQKPSPKIIFQNKHEENPVKASSRQSAYIAEESPWVYEFGAGIGLSYGVFGGRASVGNELVTGDAGLGFIPLSWDPAFSLGGSIHFLDRYGTVRPKITALWSNACGIILLYDQGNSKVLFKEYYSGFAIYGGLDIKFSRDSEYSIDINVGSVFTSVSPSEMEEKFNAEKYLLEQHGYVFSSGSASFSSFPKFSVGINYIIGRSAEEE